MCAGFRCTPSTSMPPLPLSPDAVRCSPGPGIAAALPVQVPWTTAETESFEQGLSTFGKTFHRFAEILPSRTPQQVSVLCRVGWGVGSRVPLRAPFSRNRQHNSPRACVVFCDGHCIRPTPSPHAVNPIHLSVSVSVSVSVSLARSDRRILLLLENHAAIRCFRRALPWLQGRREDQGPDAARQTCGRFHGR